MCSHHSCNLRCGTAGMCLTWILCSSNFYLLQTCPPLVLEAIHGLTSTSYTQHCSFQPKKHQSHCLCCCYLGKQKGRKLQSIPVFSQEMQSPPKAVRPHMCLVKGQFPRELRFEGKELHCVLPDHGIAHSVCQDCSSPVGLAARDSHLRGTHRLLCSHPLQSRACLLLPCGEYFGKSRDQT